MSMKLSDWLETNNERRGAFAARVGTSAGYLTDLCAGRATPSLSMARRIMEATNGSVCFEDWDVSEAQGNANG